jgi:hypothetical protein
MASARFLAPVAVLALVLASTVGHGASPKQEAKERFEKGVTLFKDGDYEAALVEFRAAYAALPHNSVRYNLGVTLQNLHRYAEARQEFEAFLEEGGAGIDKKKKQEVEGFLEELESLVSTLRLGCNVTGAKLFLNGTFKKELGTEDVLLLDVGEYDIEVRLDGWKTHYAKMEIPGGKVIDLTVELVPVKPEEPVVEEPAKPVVEEPAEPEPPVQPEPPVEKKGRSPAAFWSLLGLTLASGITAGALGGTFLAKKKDYENAGPVPGWEDKRTELERLALGADLMYGVTGALAVSTVVLAVVTFRREGKQEVSLSPMLDAPGLVVGGTF